ncbi:MAG: hypothetical protein U1A78_22060 [Polyangia bacterium]
MPRPCVRSLRNACLALLPASLCLAPPSVRAQVPPPAEAPPQQPAASSQQQQQQQQQPAWPQSPPPPVYTPPSQQQPFYTPPPPPGYAPPQQPAWPQSPPPPQPQMMMPGVGVELRTNDLNATLFQLRGEETRWVVGYRYAGFVRYQNWDPICRAPCGVAVDPNGVYSIRGMRIVPSASFLLPSSGLVRLEVDAGHTGARAGGVVLTTFGGMAATLGIVFTSLAGVGGTQGRSFLTGGLTTLALGGGMLTGGIAILIATRTKVRTGGLRLASVTPAWGAGTSPLALAAR